jgi:hypothetical protein
MAIQTDVIQEALSTSELEMLMFVLKRMVQKGRSVRYIKQIKSIQRIFLF